VGRKEYFPFIAENSFRLLKTTSSPSPTTTTTPHPFIPDISIPSITLLPLNFIRHSANHPHITSQRKRVGGSGFIFPSISDTNNKSDRTLLCVFMSYNKAIIAFFYFYSTEWICITLELYAKTQKFEKFRLC
jgi:hypothetical protein